MTDLCAIVSDATYPPLYEEMKDNYCGLPVQYVYQKTPEWRKKPLGTVQAVLACHGKVDQPFVILNGDTIYGEEPLRLVCEYLATTSGQQQQDKQQQQQQKQQQNGGGETEGNNSNNSSSSSSAEKEDTTACCPAYLLRNCLPANGSKVNRAVIKCDDQGHLISIEEQYDIHIGDIKTKYTGEELTSLNVFGFRPCHFPLLKRKLDEFMEQLEKEEEGKPPAGQKKDKTVREYILADVVNAFKPEGGFATRVLGPVTCPPLEITHEEDVPIMKEAVAKIQW